MLLNTLKAILIFLLNIIKRSLCCLRRRRKSSADVVPLTDIGVVPNNPYNSQAGDDLQSWNTWDDSTKDNLHRQPQTIQEHIEYYRNNTIRAQQHQPEDVQQNFFQDMEPTIKKTPKVCLKPKETVPALSRLAFTQDVVLPEDSGELKSWEEAEKRDGSWMDSEEWNTEEILRQKRREEKKKRNFEREQKRTLVS
ncbi:hypothetical protein O3M35_009023 [Rhynocoris fuscipes]|uniref:Receptor-binding cancer antigen expressed on SiSo cells n=1 Tax=Rhynocoris fuscipes TaxID=488301 RepID=A0AAW1D1I8_9HEMI